MISYIVRVTPVLAMVLLLTACGGDDDGAPSKRKLSFSPDGYTFHESDGTVEIEVTLDKPAIEDVTIDFSIKGGTARDPLGAMQAGLPYQISADYEIQNDDYEIEIEKGETQGKIVIDLWSDFLLEETETIILSLDKSSSSEVVLPAQKEITINIEQEHGMFVVLSWDDEYTGEDDPNKVDMDLFFWLENDESEFEPAWGFPEDFFFFGLLEGTEDGEVGLFQTSLVADYNSPEFIFLPSNIIEDGNYGIGCTYYSGPADKNIKYWVDFIEVKEDGTVANNAAFEKTYTDANINTWDQEGGEDIKLAFTFTKDGKSYGDFEYVAGATGSRIPYANHKIASGVKKPKTSRVSLSSQQIPKQFQKRFFN